MRRHTPLTKDVIFGLKNEKLMKPLIEKHLQQQLNITGRFCCYDYVNDKTIVELKSRNCSVDTYPTTILTHHKVKQMMLIDKEKYVFIKFTNGLYKCRLDNDLLKNAILGSGGRCDRGKDEIRDYYYIPLRYFDLVQRFT